MNCIFVSIITEFSGRPPPSIKFSHSWKKYLSNIPVLLRSVFVVKVTSYAFNNSEKIIPIAQTYKRGMYFCANQHSEFQFRYNIL